jgi:hypothetical protein
MGNRRYQADGFIPVNDPPARRTMTAAAVTIVKGDVLQDNGSGLATNAGTAFAATHFGVAAADCASGGTVQYYPFDTKTQYIVPVATNALISTTIIGTVCNLGNNDDLDISSNPVTGIGFWVDAIDVSAEAVAVNTYGYAIGHFVVVGVQA